MTTGHVLLSSKWMRNLKLITLQNVDTKNIKISVSHINLHNRPVAIVHDSEWIELNVTLNSLFFPSSSNQPLYVEHCVFGVCCKLVFCSIANQPFTLRSKRHVWRRDPIALIIGNYLYPAILKNSNTTSHRQYSLTDWVIDLVKVLQNMSFRRRSYQPISWLCSEKINLTPQK